ncbi:MAG TPA: nuclear transport factor 2 family protein [Chthoniobacterales bacterium]
MKRILLSAMMLLSIACGLRAQTAPDAAELTKLLKDFLAGAGRNAAAMHERFWADDLIYTSALGRRKGKADILRELRAETPKPEDGTAVYTAEEIRIQQYGDTAIVAFRLVANIKKGEKTEVANYLNTGTFLKRGGKWQAVGWQATAVPKASTPTPTPQPEKSAERS